MTTNIAVNSRSMNGIILLSDGNGTEITEGNITTNDINSGNITTNNLNSNSMTCLGVFRSNTLGQYSIPTIVSSQTGSLISYGNTSGSGATDFTNYGSTYNTLLQGFRFWNLNSTQTLFNLAIIDNTQTYFKSQLVGCTAETPLNPTSIVNKTYADSNFIDFTTDQTISASNKRFNGLFCTGLNITPTLGGSGNRQQVYVSGTSLEIVALFNNNVYRFYARDGASTQTNPLSISSASTTITNSLITNNLTADNITGTQNIYTNNTTGIINIGTGFTTGNMNIGSASSFTNVRSKLSVSRDLVLYDITAPFTNFCQLYPSGSVMSYTMNAGPTTASTHVFYAYNNTNLSKNALTISYSTVSVLEGLILSCRQIRSSNTSNGFHELFTNMTTGTLTIGSLTSFIINNSTNTLNAQHTFNNSTPICSVASPTLSTHLTRKDYIDNNFMFKTGTVTESIDGIKTFTNRVNFNGSPCFVASGNSEFSGTNGYFQINCGMSSGTYNPASQNGTIGIIGLKDQTNDKVLLTLYGSIHASVKLNFTEGVSIGFGGSTQQGNTSVTCDGTNVIIKPNIKFSGDNTIQNSAFTGAGSLNGTYNLSNITIDTNGKITSLSSGLTSTNSFSGVNTFSNNTNFSSSITLTDIANFSTIQQSSAVLNIENPTLSSTIRLKTRASTGAVQNSLTLNTSSCDILSSTLNLTSTTPTSILTPNNLNGAINLFNNLTTGGTLNIGSTSGVNVINGNTTISKTLTVNEPATFLDYIITNTGLKWVDVTPSANYVESRVLGTALGFIPSFNLNSYEFYTKNSSGTPTIPVTITNASTTLNHQLICNNGAVFNTTLPTSTINASSSSDFTIRGFTDATYQTIASMASYLTTSAAALLYQEKIVGSIIQMAVATLPAGYLACDGGSYSTATYSALSTVLNFTYGGSAPSGLFKTPDFRGMFLRGNGTNGIDSTYASATYGSLQTDGIRSHTHGIDFGFLSTVSGGGGQNAYNSTSPNFNNPGTGAGRATGITTSNNNPYPDTRPGNFCVFYCIKY